jgi:hypothetical protein
MFRNGGLVKDLACRHQHFPPIAAQGDGRILIAVAAVEN